jgi:hypothetical protein
MCISYIKSVWSIINPCNFPDQFTSNILAPSRALTRDEWLGFGGDVELVARPTHKGVREGQVKPGEVRPLSCAPWPEGASSRATSRGHRCAPWPPRGTASPRRTRLRGCHGRAPWTQGRSQGGACRGLAPLCFHNAT